MTLLSPLRTIYPDHASAVPDGYKVEVGKGKWDRELAYNFLHFQHGQANSFHDIDVNCNELKPIGKLPTWIHKTEDVITSVKPSQDPSRRVQFNLGKHDTALQAEMW
jgi:hypothetical protein